MVPSSGVTRFALDLGLVIFSSSTLSEVVSGAMNSPSLWAGVGTDGVWLGSAVHGDFLPLGGRNEMYQHLNWFISKRTSGLRGHFLLPSDAHGLDTAFKLTLVDRSFLPLG